MSDVIMTQVAPFVQRANDALVALDAEVEGTTLACGFEDALDRWDAFVSQFMEAGLVQAPAFVSPLEKVEAGCDL